MQPYGAERLFGAYSIPTANTTEIPSFRRIGKRRSQTATRGIASIIRSERTLIREAVTRREYVSMHVFPGISFLLTHCRRTTRTNAMQYRRLNQMTAQLE